MVTQYEINLQSDIIFVVNFEIIKLSVMWVILCEL